MPWRDLPKRFGNWKAVHTRFTRWAKAGVWERVFKYLAKDADNEYAMIDATIVRAHQHSAGAKKKPAKTKRSAAAKGGLSTKINATVDALGNPIGFALTPGQACDLDLGRNDGGFAGFFERVDDALVGIEAFVGDHDVGLDLR